MFKYKGTESKPKPYFEPCDKNGVPLNEKHWKDLTRKEKELRKQEELEKFKNSDRLKENIKKAEEMRKKLDDTFHKGMWFKDQVKSGGPWDCKSGGHPEMEHVGNFNYGATGKALDFTDELLKGLAGGYQVFNGPRDWSFWSSWGDDPIDQFYINQGTDWYENN